MVDKHILTIKTEEGNIQIELLMDAAPQTAQHIVNLVRARLYDGTSFYRSDFVIQCGLYGSTTTTKNTFPDLQINETAMHKLVSNTRGTCAVAHFDVPDCGNSEFFINLQTNAHLDQAYGGYCVFGRIRSNDASSFHVVDQIATKIAQNQTSKIRIHTMEYQTIPSTT